MSDTPNNVRGSIQNMLGGSVGYTRFRPKGAEEIQIGGVLNVVTDQGTTGDVQINGVSIISGGGLVGGVTNNFQYNDGAGLGGYNAMNYVNDDQIQIGDLSTGTTAFAITMETNTAAGAAGVGTDLNITAGNSDNWIGGDVTISTGAGAYGGEMTLNAGDHYMVADESINLLALTDISLRTLTDINLLSEQEIYLEAQTSIHLLQQGGTILEIETDNDLQADVSIHTGIEGPGFTSGDVIIYTGDDRDGGGVGDILLEAANVSLTTDSLTVPVKITQTNTRDLTLIQSITASSSTLMRALAVQGNYAYVIGSTLGILDIIDITDPSNMSIVGSLTDATNFNVDANGNIDIVNNVLYVPSTTNDSITSVDVSDPTTPVVISTLIDSTNLNILQDICIDGIYAYGITWSNNRFTVVNISDPENMYVVSSLSDVTNLASLNKIIYKNGYAYATGNTTDRLTIIDVSDPFNPTIASTIVDAVNLNSPLDMEITGRYLYVALGLLPGLGVVDISDPNAPVVLTGITSSGAPGGMTISGNYVYLCADGEVQKFDISVPEAPVLTIETTLAIGIGRSMIASGNTVYVTNSTDDFTSLGIGGTVLTSLKSGSTITDSLTVNQDLSVRGSTTLSGLSAGPASLGDSAVNSLGSRGKITQTNAESPTIIQQLTLASTGLNKSVAIDGNYAYTIGKTSKNLDVIDITDPSNMVVIGSLTDATNFAVDSDASISLRNNILYVPASGNDSITSVDVSDPTTPVIISTFIDGTDLNNIQDIAIQGPYAYAVTAGNNDFTVVNISDPANMYTVSNITGVNGDRLKVKGDYAYCLDNTANKFAIVDIRDPALSVVMSTTQDTTNLKNVSDLVITDRYVYLASVSGLSIVDISDPAVPVVKPFVAGNVSGIAISGNYVYGVKSSTLDTFDITVPDAPVRVNRATPALGVGRTITIVGNKAFTTSTGAEFTSFDMNGTTLSTLTSGNIKTDSLTVTQDLRVQGSTVLSGLSAGSSSLGSSAVNSLRSRGKINQTNLVNNDIIQQLVTNAVGINRSLAIEGNYAYIIGRTSTILDVIDISDPSNMSIIGSLTDATNFVVDSNAKLTIVGNILYVPSGIRISAVDVSDPTTPVLVSWVSVSGLQDMVIDGMYGYCVRDTQDTVSVVNIADPANMYIVSGVTDAVQLPDLNHIVYRNGHVYATCNTLDRLAIVDVSDPYVPVIVSSNVDGTNFNNPLGLVITDRYLYGACSNKLAIVDISDPASPVFLSVVATSVDPQGIAISGNYIYTVGSAVMDTFDITVPDAPVLVNSDTPVIGIARRIVIVGNVGYIASSTDDFTSMDMTGTYLSTLRSGNIRTGSLMVNQNLQVQGATVLSGLSAGNSSLGNSAVNSLTVNNKVLVTQITGLTVAVTANGRCGVVTTATISLAGDASSPFIVNNSNVSLGDLVFVSIVDYSTTGGRPSVICDDIVAGAFTIRVSNNHPSTSVTGKLKIAFLVV